MGRTIGPKNKIARRFGVNLGLKMNAAKVSRRLNQKPGQHGPTSRKATESSFGKQLIEKQKAKFMYGLRERQFRRYVEESTGKKGDSSVVLQQMLESRLDNVVYRLGFAGTRAQARQMVSHGMFTLNAKPMNIPSHLVQVGDIVGVKPNKVKKKNFENASELLAKKQLPSWLSVDAGNLSGKILGKAASEDFEKVFDVKLIIEYYSTR